MTFARMKRNIISAGRNSHQELEGMFEETVEYMGMDDAEVAALDDASAGGAAGAPDAKTCGCFKSFGMVDYQEEGTTSFSSSSHNARSGSHKSIEKFQNLQFLQEDYADLEMFSEEDEPLIPIMALSLTLCGRRNAANLQYFPNIPKNAIRLYQTYKEEFQIGSCCFSFETTPPNEFDGSGAGAGVVMTMRDMQPSTLRMNAGEQDIHGPRRGGSGTRIIRTPIRPLFPSGFYHNVQVNARVLCCSEHHDIDVLAANATSAALMLSDIPWGGPIGVVRVGRIQGEFVVNPVKSELACSDIDLIYACTRDKALMVDVQAQEVSEEDLAAALNLAHQEAAKYIDPQIKLAKQAGKCKKDYKLSMLVKDSTVQKFDSLAEAPFEAVFFPDSAACEKTKGAEYLAKIIGDANKVLEVEESHDIEKIEPLHPYMVDKLRKKIFHRWNVENGIRIDGRHFDEVRRVDCKYSRVSSGLQGSSFFLCGATQVSCTVTQTIPETDEAEPHAEFVDAKYRHFSNRRSCDMIISYPRYLYKTRPFRIDGDWKNCGNSGNEDEDGSFMENAFVAVLPKEDTFPYVVRCNSQVVRHDGSASTASVCGVSIALMDAGVPLRKQVAGVSMGLVREVHSGSTVHAYRF
ncbi:polyribonucleotide nucleotidyltransferase 2, mitochondrial-like [Papaver somniferum]|uniref:polyribonucleotide nucleotidyltransferase 2, mitochondrial-like n=1 Tax=Papaver somniferum TaxID=3469 RepID=UPI000E6F829C|nr:polyribonucleotide nucleotidyltransferase 2, mitochondrial-like [Papaver somniferum]